MLCDRNPDEETREEEKKHSQPGLQRPVRTRGQRTTSCQSQRPHSWHRPNRLILTWNWKSNVSSPSCLSCSVNVWHHITWTVRSSCQHEVKLTPTPNWPQTLTSEQRDANHPVTRQFRKISDKSHFTTNFIKSIFIFKQFWLRKMCNTSCLKLKENRRARQKDWDSDNRARLAVSPHYQSLLLS